MKLALTLALLLPCSALAQNPALGMYLPVVERAAGSVNLRQLAGIAFGVEHHTATWAASVAFVPTWIAEHGETLRDVPAGVLLAELRLVRAAGPLWFGIGAGAVHRWSDVWRTWEGGPVASLGLDFDIARFEAVWFGAQEGVVRVVVEP